MRIKAMEFEKDYQKGLPVCKLAEHELNNLLEESYNEGYKDGYKDAVTTKLPYRDKDRWEVSYVREESATVPNTALNVSTSPTVITRINNDIGHGSVTTISSVKPDPNLKAVGNKDEIDFVRTDQPIPPLDISHVKLPSSAPITYTNILWITEGEPDENGDYLITVEDEDFNGHIDRYVQIETYYKDEPNNGHANYEDGNGGFGAGWQTLYKVLAWAPIVIYPYYGKMEKENEID